LRQLCLGPIERLVDRVIVGYRPNVERNAVIDRTLRWVEMYLRSRPPFFFDGMDTRAFLALILSSAYKMLTPPELDGPRELTSMDSEPLQCPNGYQVWRFCLPCEQVGGDWLGVDHASGIDLWALMIDVTGHGYASYITAHGVSQLWQTRSIVELRASGKSPREVLCVMSEELEPVLPDEVFVEATLGRFTAAGQASVAGAGFCRVILRRAGHECANLRRIGGHLLGSFWGNDHDQANWSLLADDELTIASDGLYEQPDVDGRQLEDRILEYIALHLAPGRLLHNALVEIVQDVVGTQPGQDDISVLSVLRSSEVRP
jgi:serine phosphatase RsbU (regulator of sigma subunit)